MAVKIHVKKGDTVYILSGKDEGKKGKVIAVLQKEGKVIVEGVNMCTKHKKPRGMNQPGGIIHQENPIDASNIMFLCSKCKSPSKVGKMVLESGQKARICKKCNEVIDIIKETK